MRNENWHDRRVMRWYCVVKPSMRKFFILTPEESAYPVAKKLLKRSQVYVLYIHVGLMLRHALYT